MSDIGTAKSILLAESLTCVLVKGDTSIRAAARGVRPMVELIKSGTDLRGFAVADKIVGRAAAMLFVKAGIVEVYAEVISSRGAEYLAKHVIPYTYDILTEAIINRDGSGICPMERAVADAVTAEEGYRNILKTMDALSAKEQK